MALSRRTATTLVGVAALAVVTAGTAVAVERRSSAPAQPAAAPSSGPATASATPTPTPSPTATPAVSPPVDPAAAAGPMLPRGGRSVFPDFRVVAFYGLAGDSRLGVLGSGPPDRVARRLAAQAQAYHSPRRPVLPALELIVTIADGDPGEDGSYSSEVGFDTVQRYLDAARRAKSLLILDIQPGRTPFLPAVRRYEKFLAQPDVGLALDPEWSMRANQVPGRTLGSTDAATVNGVSAYLADLVRRHNLPQKLLVIHQFTADMVRDDHRIAVRPGIGVVFHVDGFGGRSAKLSKYRELHARGRHFNGFKLFYQQDRRLLSPKEVASLKPSPDLVTYQ